jgi:hypothetical protein
MRLRQPSTGFFCPFGALSAAATSLSFGGWLRRTELLESYEPLKFFVSRTCLPTLLPRAVVVSRATASSMAKSATSKPDEWPNESLRNSAAEFP